MTLDHTNRDLRVDFFRGLALLIIFSAHVRGNALLPLMPHRIAFSDSADVFVFLSGYVCGIAYYRRFLKQGFLRCQAKSLVRCGQLYFAHVATSLLLVGLVAVGHYYNPEFYNMPGLRAFSNFLSDPTLAVRKVVLFQDQFAYFAILPLYIVLILLLPTMLAIFNWSPFVMVGSSVCVYAALHLYAIKIGGSVRWFFNPLAWQLIFFTAAFYGAKGTRPSPRWARRLWFVIPAIAMLEAVFLLKVMYPSYTVPLTDKATLGPVRVVYFAFVVVLTATFLPRDLRFWHGRLARPILLCGQNALIVYCVGAVLSAIANLPLGIYRDRIWWQLLINMGGWICCIATAHLWHIGRRWVPKTRAGASKSGRKV